VRVIGERLKLTYMEELAPPPRATDAQTRTVSAWGERKQKDLVRLRVGVVGCGSVGSFIAEALTRTGFEDVVLIDYDNIEIAASLPGSHWKPTLDVEASLAIVEATHSFVDLYRSAAPTTCR
jgi:molybdopterin/thiamine biosynthesis adenylyltransferase